MSKYKVSELDGRLLDAAVALAGGGVLDPHRPASELQMVLEDGRVVLEDGRVVLAGGVRDGHPGDAAYFYSPSTDWAVGGPIIEREVIGITPLSVGAPSNQRPAGWLGDAMGVTCIGSTALIAAMRAYVASRLGDEVEL
jgi:hypothetical protein